MEERPKSAEIKQLREKIIAIFVEEEVQLPIGPKERKEFAKFLESAPEEFFLTPVCKQLQTCLTLGPWLTVRQFNTLAREIGMQMLLYKAKELPDQFVKFPRIPEDQQSGQLVFDLGLESRAEQLLRIPALHEQAVELLQTPQFPDRGDWRVVSSLLEFFDSSVSGTTENLERVAGVLGRVNYFILSLKSFYQWIPGGTIFRTRDDRSFWVEELPLINSLVYSDRAVNLMVDPLIFSSNMVHEIGSHLVMGQYLHPTVRGPNHKEFFLHSKLLLPVWFWEGAANVVCLRYFHHRDERADGVPEETDFNDLFLENWNGSIPNSQAITQASEQLPYFFLTVFCSFVLQAIGRFVDRTSSTKDAWTTIPSARHTSFGLQICLLLINQVRLTLPPEEDLHAYDIGNEFMKRLYDQAKTFIYNKYHQNIPPYSILCQQFDASRKSYVANWIRQHFTTDQQKTAWGIMKIPPLS